VKYTGFVGMLGTWLIYPLIVLLAGSWIGQLMWINRGVEHFPAVYIVAVEAVINEITGVIGGLLYFQEYRSMSDLNLGLFLLGLLIGVGGVLILATQKRPPNKSTTMRTPSKQVA